MEEDKITYCHNCGTACTQDYCPACGQRTSVYKVTFRETFQDLADQLFSISAPLPQTLKMLVVNPGHLFRDYLSGKRKSYYKPISFFLLTTLVYVLVRLIVGSEGLGQTIGDPSDNPLVDADLLLKAQDFMIHNINNLLFIFVIILALAIKLFFYRNYSLAEYMAISFYMVGFYTLLTTLNLFFIQFINKDIQYIAMLVMGVYFVYAMVSFINHRRWLSGIKAFAVFILAYILYLLLAFNLSYLIIVLLQ